MARGRPSRSYRTSWGEELQGFSRRSDGRWRIAATGERFTEPDERLAVQRFKAWRAANAPAATIRIDGEMLADDSAATTVATSNGEPIKLAQALAEARQRALGAQMVGEGVHVESRELRIGYDVPERVVWAWLREQLIERPEVVARMTGLPEIAAFRNLPLPKRPIRLETLIQAYKEHGNGTPESKRLAENTFREFMRLTGATTVPEITPDKLATYRDKIRARLSSPASIAAYFGRVKWIVRFGKSEGMDAVQIDRCLSLLEMLKAPADKRALQPTPVTPAEFQKLLTTARKDYPEWVPRLWLMLNCCLHFGEALQVQWSEIDLQAGTYCSKRNKRGRVIRCATLWKETIAELKKIRRTGSPYIFVSNRGTAFNPKGQWKTWEQLRNAAGLPHVQLDDVRDGAYTAACNATGVEEKLARLLAGHRSHGLQDNYVQRNPAIVRPACDAVYAEFVAK